MQEYAIFMARTIEMTESVLGMLLRWGSSTRGTVPDRRG